MDGKLFVCFSVISELIIGHLLAKGCPTTAALTPQNFGVIDLRYHFAVHNSAGGGLLDGLQGISVVQGITKIEVHPFFQQIAIGRNLSLQFDLDVQQGLSSSAWYCHSAQVGPALMPGATGSH